MLRDRYEPINLFDLIPQLDLHLEPLLIQLDGLLEEDVLFARVREDLARRYPQTRTRGRPSTPVEVILRLLVVMRLYRWSFQQTEYFVNDSLVLRQFCRVYLERVPDDTTLIRWAQLIGPETLHQLNDRVVQLAHRLKVTRAASCGWTLRWCRPTSTTPPTAACSATGCACCRAACGGPRGC